MPHIELLCWNENRIWYNYYLEHYNFKDHLRRRTPIWYHPYTAALEGQQLYWTFVHIDGQWSFTPFTLIMFAHVVYINLHLMTPIEISGSDWTVCKWILRLETTKFLQMILKERNDSIPLICLFSFRFQACQARSFVLGFIPLIGEPACLLSQLVHAHCSQGHGWLDSLALNDILCGLSWRLGQDWYHEEMDQMPTVTKVKSVRFDLPD